MLLADVVGACNIFAFEPTPISFRRLVENWKLNGWQTDSLFQAAVGAKSGDVFVQDMDSPVTTSTVTSIAGYEHFVKVPLVYLDHYRYYWEGRSGCKPSGRCGDFRDCPARPFCSRIRDKKSPSNLQRRAKDAGGPRKAARRAGRELRGFP